MRIDILTMFPEMFGDFRKGPVISRAEKNRTLDLRITDIKEYADGCFRKIDDSPYGGGPGMVLRCQPVADAIRDAKKENGRVILMDPAGTPLTQKKARELSREEQLVLVCGHYEGFDARIFHYADEAISLGDFILTGGEIPAMAVTDAVARLLPGSLREGSAEEESFESGLLEYPQYTKPRDFEGYKVPEVLFSGDHEAVRRWRMEAARKRTEQYRPDLLRKKEEEERQQE
ncbi:MAG: tRNA (guanosine(37)-N1)-methyltransferase TrmD [Clostridium sp.]|nr:tRNA (guanosine(37)-N1)-methyltransferase TrmD [Clostridium sp.]